MTDATRVAAIDCGTNSIRLLITDLSSSGQHDVLREMRIVRLGQNVDRTKHLDEAAIERTLTALREYRELIASFEVAHVRFCATSAVRDADNGAQFADRVEALLGVRPQVLAGTEEAAASFLGATRALGPGRTVVVDIGGGSTEIVVGDGATIESAVSLDIGSVRLTERFFASDPPTVDEITACIDHLDAVLAAPTSGLASIPRLVGVAGTVTTVAAHVMGLASYDSQAIHGARLLMADVRAACLSLVQMSVADRRALGFMHPGRADVIGAGALILDRLIEALPIDSDAMLVSESDILDGIAWSAIA
ncbi:MAG TPA: Ppx/GppA phosphatase family protein [Aeromicrobium sp.]|nr:Ppx/GppA phosphatase family protein [Aeromicrobium sp.]